VYPILNLVIISDSHTSGKDELYRLGYKGLHSVLTLKTEHLYRHPFIEYAANFMEHKNQFPLKDLFALSPKKLLKQRKLQSVGLSMELVLRTTNYESQTETLGPKRWARAFWHIHPTRVIDSADESLSVCT
jgi:hypothetical protein